MRKLLALLFIFAGMAALLAVPAATAQAQSDAQLERGEYLTAVSGCVFCHTPLNLETFTPQEDKLWSGGEPFPVPGLGTVYSKNLTSDVATGLGGWTDDEIKTAITTGVSRDGLKLFPIMPYHIYNNLAQEDLDAIVTYLRTIPPISNTVDRTQLLPDEAYPVMEYTPVATAPDSSDTEARGVYLMTSILVCIDCHTPVDPETGAPVMEMYLAGGQPFEGPWGVVYGGNITPHQETGIGTWTDAQIERVMREGVRPDGRRAVVMPWPIYANLTDDDMAAAIHYMKNNVPSVENTVPAAALNEGFVQYAEISDVEEDPGGNNIVWYILGAVVVGLGVYLISQSGAKKPAEMPKDE